MDGETTQPIELLGRLAGGALAVTIAAPLSWLTAGFGVSLAGGYPPGARNYDAVISGLTIGMIVSACVAAGVAGAATAPIAIRWPTAAAIRMTLVTQALGILLMALAMGEVENVNPVLPALFGFFASLPMLPVVALGAVMWLAVVHIVGPILVPSKDVGSPPSQVDAPDGLTGGLGLLTATWLTVGIGLVILLVLLVANSNTGP